MSDQAKDTPEQAEFRAYCKEWLANNHPGQPPVHIPQGALELSDPDALAWLQVGEFRVRLGIATGLVIAGDRIGEGASEEEAIVGAVKRKASAVCPSVQPRAARNSRIAILSVGG